jgi:hypothetical protein
MATQDYNRYCITPFWTNGEYRDLEYTQEEFNDAEQLASWQSQGYTNVTGDMCDMRKPQPRWNQRFIDMFTRYGWQDIGTSYYRMMPGTVLPTHQDRYVRYIDLFNLAGREHTIRRAIVFLEAWQPGHSSECAGEDIAPWTAGTVIEWPWATPHMAGNTGTVPRYTLQLTGHL